MKFNVCHLPKITILRGMMLLFLTALVFTVYQVFHQSIRQSLSQQRFDQLIPNEEILQPSERISQSPSNQSTNQLSETRPKTILLFNNENICVSNATEMSKRSVVIIVLSGRKNFAKRNLIRKTWGSIRDFNNINILAVVFMLGNLDASGEETTDVSKLLSERNQFGDVVIGNFVDSYRNLTLKSIMAFEWLSSYCSNADLVVKTDDDVMLNIFQLTENLNSMSENEVKTSNIWCTIHYHEHAITAPNSRFYVSPDEFPGALFPTHCAGVGYVTTLGVIERIMDEISRSFLARVCTHEDVFMTGIVPQKINSQIEESTTSSSGSLENMPINLINKRSEWETYALEFEKGEDAEFLLKLFHTANITEGFVEFRKRFGTKVFYLLTHGSEFEQKYQRLWEIIVKFFNKSAEENF